jgi:hypothetical protein
MARPFVADATDIPLCTKRPGIGSTPGTLTDNAAKFVLDGKCIDAVFNTILSGPGSNYLRKVTQAGYQR